MHNLFNDVKIPRDFVVVSVYDGLKQVLANLLGNCGVSILHMRQRKTQFLCFKLVLKDKIQEVGVGQ